MGREFSWHIVESHILADIMKVDITSMFFNSSIEGQTATPAWGTSIGQSKSKGYRINDFKQEVVDVLIGMLYKSISDVENIDVSGGSSSREILTSSVFQDIYINNQKIENAQFVLLLFREHSSSHDGRMGISYAPYIKYNGISNQDCIDKMHSVLGCSVDGCWFVYDISIKKQSELHFSAVVVNPTSPMTYAGISSKQRSAEWKNLIPTSDEQPAVDININTITSTIKSTGLIYSDTLIKRLAYSLMAKPCVIFSGLAGSGKTQLALAFAKCLSENIEEQVCTVSIGADWTNREPLLGYPNALKNNEYVKPECGVLQLLMRANDDPSKPYFLILDEMNLSVVERYFADFLSAMESGEPIKLWDSESEDVPKEILLPKNVFIIGTINVDETTYMFSPKVLDRANVIEFKIAADEMDEYLGKKININLESAYSACADMAVDFVNKANSQVEKDDKNKDVLLSFFRELKKVNAEFGYRTVNEISRYLHFANGDLADDAAIDTAILQKLLPKLHGSRKKLEPVLQQLWKLCFMGAGKDLNIAQEHVEKAEFKESADKIRRMYESAAANGFTSIAEA